MELKHDFRSEYEYLTEDTCKVLNIWNLQRMCTLYLISTWQLRTLSLLLRGN